MPCLNPNLAIKYSTPCLLLFRKQPPTITLTHLYARLVMHIADASAEQWCSRSERTQSHTKVYLQQEN